MTSEAPWDDQSNPERVSATFKAGSSFADPWIPVKAGSVAELNQTLDDLIAGDTAEKVVTFARQFHSLWISGGGSPAPAPAPAQAPQQAPAQQPAPQAQQQATAGPGKFCGECGQAMTHKSGNKNGKQWSGWFCSVKEHKPVWG